MKSGFMAVDALIMKSNTPDRRLDIQRLQTLREKMDHLCDYFKPSTVEWRKVLKSKLEELCKPSPGNNLIERAEEWIILEKEVQDANLHGENNITMQDAFIEAVSDLDYPFSVPHFAIAETDSEGTLFTLATVIKVEGIPIQQ